MDDNAAIWEPYQRYNPASVLSTRPEKRMTIHCITVTKELLLSSFDGSSTVGALEAKTRFAYMNLRHLIQMLQLSLTRMTGLSNVLLET